jgi:hypothetical protein
MSHKILFAIAAVHNLEIEHMDVKTAFLYGDIDVEVYVEQPDGFTKSGKSDKVCKLRKALKAATSRLVSNSHHLSRVSWFQTLYLRQLRLLQPKK